MNKLLSAVFSSQFNHGMHSRSKDYHAKSAIVENIVNELDNLKRKEHQSGAFRALVSACAGSNITQAELARQLKIHRNAVRAVMFFKTHFFNSNFFTNRQFNGNMSEEEVSYTERLSINLS